MSPYRSTSDDVRDLVGEENFIEIFVDTPIEVCEKRDTKGLYAKARSGAIKDFTGVEDVYESPERPAIVLETVSKKAKENASQIIDYLHSAGFLRAKCSRY